MGLTDKPTYQLFTVAQVAAMLQISKAWVLQHARCENGKSKRRPEIPCVRLGRAVRFKPEAIEAFIKSVEQWAEADDLGKKKAGK